MFLATIKSTMDACDVVDHDLAKLVAGLLEVRRKEKMVNKISFLSTNILDYEYNKKRVWESIFTINSVFYKERFSVFIILSQAA